MSNIKKIEEDFVHKQASFTFVVLVIVGVIFVGIIFTILAIYKYQHVAIVNGKGYADSNNYSVPGTIASDCSVDNTSDLQSFLTTLPANSVVNFPSGGCYLIQSRLNLTGINGLTINGNGSTLKRTDTTEIQSKKLLPIIFIANDNNISINGLNLDGSYDGSNYGGVGYEDHYGLLLECSNNVSLTNLSVKNIQGDFLNLQAPFSTYCSTTGKAINNNVNVTNSTFTNAGYHGIVFEAINGTNISNNTFDGMGVDAIDAEYDVYSTIITNGRVTTAAEDNINVSNNTWANFKDIWFASIQGQSPGVQEQNVTLTGNTIQTGSGLIQILGTDQTKTTSDYWNNGLTITNNTIVNGQTAKAVNGGSIATPYADSIMKIKNVSNVKLSDNTFPVYDGTVGYYYNHPYLAALQAISINGLTLSNNSFSGALGILHPNSASNNVANQCGNKFGVGGGSVDYSCAPTPTCPSGQTGTPPNCVTPGGSGNPGNNGGGNGGSSGSGNPSNNNPGDNNTNTTNAIAAGKGVIVIANNNVSTNPNKPTVVNIPVTNGNPPPNIVIGLPNNVNLDTILKAEYFLDHKLSVTVAKEPFTTVIKTSKLSPGCHSLETKIVYKSGNTKSTYRNICIAKKKTSYSAGVIVLIASIVLLAAGVIALHLYKNNKPPRNNFSSKNIDKTTKVVVG